MLAATGALGLVALGGCLEAASDAVLEGNPYAPGELILVNQDDVAHDLTVRATLDGETVAEKSVSVSGAGRKAFERFLTGTDRYRVTVAMDGSRMGRFEYKPEDEGGGGRSLLVRITGPSKVEWVIDEVDSG